MQRCKTVPVKETRYSDEEKCTTELKEECMSVEVQKMKEVEWPTEVRKHQHSAGRRVTSQVSTLEM